MSQATKPTDYELTAQMEPFDSFWEGPEDIQKGFTTVFEFYRHNYLPRIPSDRHARILVVSCGPGYFVDMLVRHGYSDVIGIDSDAEKIKPALQRDLNCLAEHAFPYLAARREEFDVIFCEQELNHLTKDENLAFLELCRASLKPGGRLIGHGLNGANPLTGSEALAQNFDHYNTFTEYTLNQMLDHMGFSEIQIFPLNLYVFYKNPFNWVAWGASSLLSLFFRATFILYGKNNRIFTKKIAFTCQRSK
jgi:2-polyprenyl-3-methyl-5-hydroxy-6-metoxy-1,4-benzoquinol methylase